MSFPAKSALRKLVRRQPLALLGALLLIAFFLCGLAAPWIAPANPSAIDLIHRLQGPSAAHWAGTDELGRDILSRLLFGARLSLAVSVSVVSISLTLGLAIGGLAGYLGGWIDTALTTFAMNTFLALPGILLAIAFAAFLGPGFTNLVLALAIGGWAGYARLVRAQVMAVREREYVEAARALGAGGMRISSDISCPTSCNPFWFKQLSAWRESFWPKPRCHFWALAFPRRRLVGAPCSTMPACTCSILPTSCSSLPPPSPRLCLASILSAMPFAIN